MLGRPGLLHAEKVEFAQPLLSLDTRPTTSAAYTAAVSAEAEGTVIDIRHTAASLRSVTRAMRICELVNYEDGRNHNVMEQEPTDYFACKCDKGRQTKKGIEFGSSLTKTSTMPDQLSTYPLICT